MISPTVGIISPGDRIDKITKPLDTTEIRYKVNPDHRNFDIIICDTPDRQMFKEVIRNKFRSNILLFRMRGDPYWGIDKWINSKIKQKLALSMLKHVDGCIAIADHQADKYWNKTSIDTKIIKTSIDPKEWPNTYHQFNFIRAITLTNAMYPNKINPIIKNVKKVDKYLEENKGKWYICGEGKYEERLELATNSLKNVQFVGYQDAKDVLNWANVMLHLSNFDSYANAILEGMASGLPVLASNYPAFTNPTYPINIVDNFSDIERLFDKYKYPKERTYAGRKNYKWIKNNATHEIVGKKWVSTLNYFKLRNSNFKTAYGMIKNE